MKKMHLAIGIVLILCLCVFAQDEGSSKKEYTMAVNASWIGLFTGSYSANFEYLMAQSHGVLAEGYFATDDDYTSMGGGLGYRWHWSKKKGMGSGFLGLAASYRTASGDVTVNNVKSDFTSTIISVIPYIGKRWIFGPGINIVLRAGYGYADASFEWSDVALVDDTIEKALKFLGSFDGELSIGFAF
jgi:hypothetical protein